MPTPYFIKTEDLKDVLESDPYWLAKASAKEPIVVTDYCDLSLSGIAALSPHVEFRGRNDAGRCAEFLACEQLKVAEGIFHGMVDFTQSGVERIGELTILQPDNTGNAARFRECLELKEARGNYPGFVNFGRSGIVKITDLKVMSQNQWRMSADFSECMNLKVARGYFDGPVSFKKSGIQEVKDIVVPYVGKDPAKIDLDDCNQLIRCPESIYNDPMVRISATTVGRILGTAEREKRARKEIKGQTFEL